jgi:hypothetical protein
MPFQSEKQRRYMHANLPDIAKRWERDYSNGGIAELNAELNSLPEYYLPKAHGGLIPSHEAGIYGLEDGGQLVKPGPGRPGYGGPHETEQAGRDYADTSPSDVGSGKGVQDYEYEAYNPPETKTITPDDSADEDKALSYVNWNVEEKYTGTEDLEEQLEIDKQNALTKLRYDPNLTKQEKKNLEVGLGFRPAKTKNKFLSFLGNAALAIIPGLLPAKLATTFRVGKLGYDLAYTDKYDATIAKFGFNKNDLLSKGRIQFSTEEKLREETQKLKEALPKNHPESIALEAQTKTKTSPKMDEDGVNIKYTSEEITDTNDAKADIARLEQKYLEMNEASRLAWLRQQQMNRDKQMAYYKMFRKRYVSAQGGRVPAGYNTGGLSDLFRLKNI